MNDILKKMIPANDLKISENLNSLPYWLKI